MIIGLGCGLDVIDTSLLVFGDALQQHIVDRPHDRQHPSARTVSELRAQLPVLWTRVSSPAALSSAARWRMRR